MPALVSSDKHAEKQEQDLLSVIHCCLLCRFLCAKMTSILLSSIPRLSSKGTVGGGNASLIMVYPYCTVPNRTVPLSGNKPLLVICFQIKRFIGQFIGCRLSNIKNYCCGQDFHIGASLYIL